MVEKSAVDEMLDQLRFDDAARLVEESEELDSELHELVARRRAEAEERARSLAQLVVDLGDQRDMPALIDLVHDFETRPLLGLLSDSMRRRPELFLREAARWEDQRRETNTRRLAEARKALDGLDLELARGLMNRIDGRFLTGPQVEERDQLLLDISARSMELESLDETGERLIGQKGRRSKRDEDRPWWRRWFG
jgi:hypothetical protein